MKIAHKRRFSISHTRFAFMNRLPPLHTETIALLASLFLILACNQRFWNALLASQSTSTFDLWSLMAGTAVFLIGLHWAVLLLVVNRWTVKPLLAGLFVLTSLAAYFMENHGVYLDKAMLRNLIETDVKEASELLEWPIFPHLLLLGILPTLLLWSIKLRSASLRSAVGRRVASLALAMVLTCGSLWFIFPTMVPLMRAQEKMRYLIAPQNYLVSMGRVLSVQARTTLEARETIGIDAHQDPVAKTRPTALVLVVGETVRAANWGLGGYQRQTTPELAKRNVINFTDVTSCGTDTATSLPCMFSVFGRRAYDETRIRNSDSLLQIIHRAGVSVLWRDNQSGSKGVDDGLPYEDFSSVDDPSLLSPSGHPYDEILLKGLKEKITSTQEDVLIVLHMLGNHGPAYFQRYPPEFRMWQPTCDSTQLDGCTRESLINTYDNAILYTDYVLGRAIDLLAGIDSHDTGLIYLSDHGESLGEHHLYLHGMPYAIAPREQTSVPLVMWFSPSLKTNTGLADGCLAKRAAQPASHDNLFHTLLGLLGVETTVYEPALDLTATCLPGAAADHELYTSAQPVFDTHEKR
ncbi:MAG: phosphoethanolamine transferase [Desulfobulbaceae bacterium]